MTLPMPADVRAECARRMRLLLGARDDRHLEQTLVNNLREAFRLHDKAPFWDEGDGDRLRVLKQLDNAVEDLRAASNKMEECPPADFAEDRHWPRPPEVAASMMGFLRRISADKDIGS